MAASSPMELPLLEPSRGPPRTTTPPTTPARPRRKPIPRFQHWCAATGRNLWADIRRATWRDGLMWLPLYLVLGAVCVLLVFLLRSVADTRFTNGLWKPSTTAPGCLPDGSFGRASDYDPWAITGFFQITLRSGSLSFTNAKIIDVTWDIVVGRVGQSIMAYYSWKAFSSYVRVSMETGPVTLDTFFITHLEEAPSLKSTAHMIRDFSTRKGLRSRLAMVYMVVTMAFVLAWPTLASAMTGYTSVESAFLLDHEENLMSMASVHALAYVIHDGWRVGLDGEYLIAYDGRMGSTGYFTDSEDACIKGYSTGPCASVLTSKVSAYVDEFGFLGVNEDGDVNKITTQWNDTALEPPALNISAFYVPEIAGVYDEFQERVKLVKSPLVHDRTISYTVVDSNTTYSNEFVMENGRCQTREDFQWGFSFLQLFVNIVFLIIWIIGIWILWLKAHKEIKRRDGVEVSARYRAVLDLAAAIADDQDASSLTNEQLTAHVKKQLRGGSIEARSTAPLSKYRFRDTLWPWIKGHAWWLVLLFCLGPSGPLIPMFIGVIAVAILVGRTTASRVLLFLCGFLVVCAAAVPTLIALI